jgi:hypothetical protein
VSKKILIPRARLALAPINETEIAILGGYDGTKNFNDVVILNTKTSKCEQVASGGNYKFLVNGNQCAQIDINIILALAVGVDGSPALISWTKGEQAVTIIEKFED